MAGGPHGPLPARGGWGNLRHDPGDAPALPPHIKADFHARLDFSLDFAHAAAAGRALDRARLSTRLARSGGRGRGGLFFCPPEERRSRCGTAAAVLSGACLGAFCRRTRSGGGADPPGLHGAGGEVGDGGDARRRRRRASQLPRAAVSGAAWRLVTTRHDRTSALVISSLFARAQVGLCAGIGVGVSGREGRRGRGGQRYGRADTLRNRRRAAPPPRLVPSTPIAPPGAARPVMTGSAKCNTVCR